ncbi:unnamed protein product [Tuber melanosporum]|uniref:(Perigord truffle) hypothetical protein n=1 Tax=Tuber melanosporum (strain Mel28) TaxID=656061 RepID=D5GM76_TUBMM|nr:uncharacterized protein GSTUM_00010557001 [Tuber melanosporum]CAZ85619.1 unnamed protein product [Tuber melanosporum]
MIPTFLRVPFFFFFFLSTKPLFQISTVLALVHFTPPPRPSIHTPPPYVGQVLHLFWFQQHKRNLHTHKHTRPHRKEKKRKKRRRRKKRGTKKMEHKVNTNTRTVQPLSYGVHRPEGIEKKGRQDERCCGLYHRWVLLLP